MQKVIIITCLTLSVLMILDQSGILNSLFIFLLVGALPGTHFSIPPAFMLLLCVCAIWLLAFKLVGIETFYSLSTKKDKNHLAERKKRMPKRRFSEI